MRVFVPDISEFRHVGNLSGSTSSEVGNHHIGNQKDGRYVTNDTRDTQAIDYNCGNIHPTAMFANYCGSTR